MKMARKSAARTHVTAKKVATKKAKAPVRTTPMEQEKSQDLMMPPPEEPKAEEPQKAEPPAETPRADVPTPPQLDKEAEKKTKEGLQQAIDRHAEVPKAPPKQQHTFTPGGEIVTDPISDAEAKEKLRQQVTEKQAGEDAAKAEDDKPKEEAN